MILSKEITCSLVAVTIAQAIKIPIHYFIHNKWDFTLVFSTGGMPSSHAASVWSLATAIGYTQGTDSAIFAVAFTLATIVSYDAMGVRRAAGTHAEVINTLVEDFKLLFSVNDFKYDKKLKILLGHKPQEVFMGTLLGILVSVILFLYVF